MTHAYRHGEAGSAGRLQIVHLRADYLDCPLGLENPHPQFSWRLESNERNVRQAAYRVLVSTSEDDLLAGRGELWDSGRSDSSRSFGVRYEGKPLTSRQRCFWAVQVWDERGEPCSTSAPSWWEMGLMEPKDWIARWLAVEDEVARVDREFGLRWIWGALSEQAHPRRFRLRFRLPAASKGGELLAVINEFLGRLSGIWIDDHALGATDATRRSGRWLDVPPLQAGEHLLAMEIEPIAPSIFMSASAAQAYGTAFFARLILQNGEILRIGSGPDFKTGVTNDAGWRARSYDDAGWEPARESPPPSEGYQPWPPQPAMYLRRQFSIDEAPQKARLYAAALGGYEAWMNGQRVGDAQLISEPSQFLKRTLYRTFDVTHLLQSGRNALGLLAGDGWYAGSVEGRYAWGPPPRRVLAQLELTFKDGSRTVIATDADWRIATSSIQSSELSSGEVHDARLEQAGWNGASFDDSQWPRASVAQTPCCRLVAHTSPPVRITRVIQSQNVTQPRPGIYVLDFGEHFSGWCRLRVKGERDRRIELRFAELLTPSGEIDPARWSMGAPRSDVFILKGAAEAEVFEPRFTYRGFRYVEVSGLPGPPGATTVEGCVAHSDLQVTGSLHADDPLIEKIWSNAVRTQRSNFVAVPTDCPNREQRAYMADIAIFWDAAAFNMDVCAFTSRQMDNVADDQAEDGGFPIYAPMSRKMAAWLPSDTPPAWSDGAVILPWIAWQRYGDLNIVARHWGAMNRYLQYIAERNPDFVWRNARGSDLGDWLAVEQKTHDPSIAPTTPRDLIGTAYWAYSATLLSKMSRALGRMEDAGRLEALFERIRFAFNEAFVKPDGVVGNGSQTSSILALKFDLVPANMRPAIAAHLAADVRRRGVALSTGIIGTQYILDVLVDAGYAELAYSLLLRRQYPSWGYMIDQGATTMWENWSGELEEAGKQSRNHFALGSVGGFLFRRVAGIDARTPGFRTISINPVLDPRIKCAGADYESVMGRISTDWQQTPDGDFAINVVIPANAAACIHLPAGRGNRIEESGHDISPGSDFRITKCSERETVVEVGSGTYRFLAVNSLVGTRAVEKLAQGN